MYEVEIKKGGVLAQDTKLYAEEVDTSDPFWVRISKFRQPVATNTSIILPEDEVFKEYSKYEYILLPHHQLGFVGKIKEQERLLKVLPPNDE